MDGEEDIDVISKVQGIYFLASFVHYLCLNIAMPWKRIKGTKNKFSLAWVDESDTTNRTKC